MEKSVVFYVIGIFISIFIIVSYIWKPLFLFNTDGSLKEFGVGYKNKTIMPLWLFSIVLGILSYMSVMYYNEFYRRF
jgi:hypothetical protein